MGKQLKVKKQLNVEKQLQVKKGFKVKNTEKKNKKQPQVKKEHKMKKHIEKMDFKMNKTAKTNKKKQLKVKKELKKKDAEMEKVSQVSPVSKIQSKGHVSKVLDNLSKTRRPSGIIYTRTSSKANQHSSSKARQQKAGLASAQAAGVMECKTISEVVSGSVPVAKREVLRRLITEVKPKKIFVESARAISRNARVGEELYEMCREHGVEIVPNDMPQLFNLSPSATDNFVRRLTLAYQELEKDVLVNRLGNAIRAQVAKSQKVTQSGQVKVQGSNSILEQLGADKALPQPTLRKLYKLSEDFARHRLTCRSVHVEVNKILQPYNQTVAIMTATRMMNELRTKFVLHGGKVKPIS